MATKLTSGARSDINGHAARVSERVRRFQQPGALDMLSEIEQEAAERKKAEAEAKAKSAKK